MTNGIVSMNIVIGAIFHVRLPHFFRKRVTNRPPRLVAARFP